MAEEQAPASGVGLVTISLAWDEGKGDANAQIVIGGNWGSTPSLALERLLNTYQLASGKAQEALIEQKVQERTAQKAECPQ